MYDVRLRSACGAGLSQYFGSSVCIDNTAWKRKTSGVAQNKEGLTILGVGGPIVGSVGPDAVHPPIWLASCTPPLVQLWMLDTLLDQLTPMHIVVGLGWDGE